MGVIMMERQFVIFKIDGEEFGINISSVMEIIQPIEIIKVPRTPEYVEGIINLRGKVYTIINLRKRLSLPAEEINKLTKIVIINNTESPTNLGFLVDEVIEIVTVEESDVYTETNELKRFDKNFIQCEAKLKERTILIIDAMKIIDI
jgi:purine-binding chemotaxis protein CheW